MFNHHICRDIRCPLCVHVPCTNCIQCKLSGCQQCGENDKFTLSVNSTQQLSAL